MKTYLILLLSLLSISISKKGFSTRYWDCCKPHCSWPMNSDYKSRMCDIEGKNVLDFENYLWEQNACVGGQATTCLSQIPWAVNDTLSYGFAATPGGENVCGKCYELTFDGYGHWENSTSNAKIKGKKMVIMATNIGYDVVEGQFDLMIPGGGVGLFYACDEVFKVTDRSVMGKTYGGLLSVCEEDIVGYKSDETDEDRYVKRKACLKEQCEKAFGSIPEALEGCMWHVNWFEAAGNPSYDYEEVACPQELVDKY